MMMRIKGSYVATVTIDFDYDVNDNRIKSFEEVKDVVNSGGLNQAVTQVLTDEFAVDDIVKVTVEQIGADLYCKEDE